ncbi:MAG: hypothetical protein WC861_00150 [Candidatus Micrarchaeia archaeon]|jgi:hypothetical protein
MRIPEGMLENTSAALALLAFLLSLAGMVASLSIYASAYFALSSAEAALMPQFDSASVALSDAGASVLMMSGSSSSAYSTISNLSSGLQSYSDSTAKLSLSLSDIAALPLFSLDTRLQSAADDMRTASAQFSNASQSASQMAASTQAALSSLQAVSADIDNASSSLSAAKQSFKSALSAINLLALLFSVCLFALFCSVMLLSVSAMLSHYPNMLQHAEKEKAAAAKQQK